jgi:hypothetical protein
MGVRLIQYWNHDASYLGTSYTVRGCMPVTSGG